MPSSRRQISTTAPALSSASTRSPARHAGRVRRTASQPPSRFRSSSPEGTGHSCSSATPNPSRLVARTRTVADRSDDRLDHRPRRPERARSCRKPAAATTLQRRGDTVGQAHPRLLDDAEYGGHRLGHRGRDHQPAASSITHTPSGKSGLNRAATSSASRVLPTPPTPVKRHQPVGLERRLQLGDRDSRPTKLVVAAAGFPVSNRASSTAGTRCAARAGPGKARPVSRYRAIAAAPVDQIHSVSRPAVAPSSRIWPPWPAAITRAVRLSTVPK